MSAPSNKPFPWGLSIGIAVFGGLGLIMIFGSQIAGLLDKASAVSPVSASSTAPVEAPAPYDETPDQALQRIIAAKKVINTHEHVQGPTVETDLLKMMDANGMHRVCLMGSSKFTLTLNEKVGFTDYDVNNEAILKMQLDLPDRFEAWPTIDPLDPKKLDKVKSLHERGAKGIKLYIGHGYIRRDTGDYMFHTVAMDDPELMDFYAYCEREAIPLCLHVNPYLRGFAQELVAVLTKFPDLKVNCPHFILSSIREERLIEFFDTFPNLYSDISFGHDDFLRDGVKRVSKDTEKFKELFNRYPNRFFFGTDLVLTDYEGKSPEWMQVRVQTYYDMMTKATYTTPLVPGTTLRGLELRGPLLDNVLYKNFEEFEKLAPKGTKITHVINWKQMGVDPVDRLPGQKFPPEPKGSKATGKKKPFDPLGSIERDLKSPIVK